MLSQNFLCNNKGQIMVFYNTSKYQLYQEQQYCYILGTISNGDTCILTMQGNDSDSRTLLP